MCYDFELLGCDTVWSGENYLVNPEGGSSIDICFIVGMNISNTVY